MIAFSRLGVGALFFSGVGKALCFRRDKNAVLVFCREGPESAGIGRFPDGERGGHDRCALQHEGPIQAHIINCHVQVQSRADGRVQVKHPGIPDAMWERYSRLGV